MNSFGFTNWREMLVAECHAAAVRNRSACIHISPSVSGRDATDVAVSRYAEAVFCVQPPGDTVARAAIIDAVSVGCVPVLLHPAQLRLWPWHWDAALTSYHEDWTQPTERNASRLMRRLLSMSPVRVQKLQRAVHAAADRLVYSRENLQSRAAASHPDATELLVRGILSGSSPLPLNIPPPEWSARDGSNDEPGQA
jgi:hypothetical protein